MLHLKEQCRIQYGKIRDVSFTSIDDKSYDLNVFIPKYGRDMFLMPCINYFRKAAVEADLKIRLVVIEHDYRQKCRYICASEDIDYIHIPPTPVSIFNKSLCYNLAYLLVPKTEWVLFHDIDIIPPHDFFINLKKRMGCTDKNWIQPYRGKSVCYLNGDVTNRITTAKDVINLNDLVENKDFRRGTPGAPGGSICIPSAVFQMVGGYDPEIFSDYSPEDDMLWRKLEALSHDGREPMKYVNCHSGLHAEYMEDTDLYHLHHLPSRTKSISDARKYMIAIESFKCMGQESKMEYMKLCSQLLRL